MDLLTVSIGVGLAVSLLFSELFGLAAGGMVVPGYIALYLDRPIDIALTILAAILTYALVHSLSTVVIVYGRRRTVLMILAGYLIGVLISLFPVGMLTVPQMATSTEPIVATEFGVIGFIIPGLLAIWIDRQGMLETISVMLTAAVVVRLLLIVFAVEGLV